MITVAEAERLIQTKTKNFGNEEIAFDSSVNRILAEDIVADRDFPPFNRATMDGIALNFNDFQQGKRNFKIIATQSAGTPSIQINNSGECIEIMTGAGLHESVDTVIRYEDVSIKNEIATIQTDNIFRFQSIHKKAIDKTKGTILVRKNKIVDASVISILATVGKSVVLVKKLPKVAIISTGDELVNINEIPDPYQIRESNNHTIKAILKGLEINAGIYHVNDDPEKINKLLKALLENHDVILLSGGVSMGKFDHIPASLKENGVIEIFHNVKQRPGKPFFFGQHVNDCLIFGLPGNPVSSFFCMYRYFIPWLLRCLQVETKHFIFAQLQKDINFSSSLEYYIPVKLEVDNEGRLFAEPLEGNGSGDLANLLSTKAFMELPSEQNNFTKGSVFKVWPFKPIY